jgi:CxxC motif-containing protein (DUF1111 family)
MRNVFSIIIKLSGAAIFFIAGCSEVLPPAPEAKTVLAGPMEGLTPEQVRTHFIGDEEFGKIFSREEGLGPIFVSNACESCHIGDGKGHPLKTLTRFGRYQGNTWDPMREQGGTQLQQRAISGYPPETIPAEASGITRLMPPAVTGMGFLEAVPDAAIIALADPGDVNGDDISGVPNYIRPPEYFEPKPHHIPDNGLYIGRFGKKAGAIDLLQQVVLAYKEDIGITSDFDPVENFNVEAGNFSGDEVNDPELSATVVRNVVFYIQTLKVPPRRNPDDSDVRAGETIFGQIGCTSCHTPILRSGKSDIAALSEKEFHPYTDLLLHDMGAELDDGYTEGAALSSEWRTAPLWGIGLAEDSQGGQAFYLHDGRATTLREAIEYHGGEGANSRDDFRNLSTVDQERLIKFLNSL